MPNRPELVSVVMGRGAEREPDRGGVCYLAGEGGDEVKAASTPFPGAVEANKRLDCLVKAANLVNGDRNVQYGDPSADFKRTANMWAAYLGTEVAPCDVAAMMALLKISRISWSPHREDSWVDLAGYAACGNEVKPDDPSK